MIFGKKLSVASYRIALTIRLLLTVHVGYMYSSFSADTMISKGGTFIEASLDPVNYLPYVTTNDADKFYQSLIFNGCVFPSVSGTQIIFSEELCDVTTNDSQTYWITIKPGKTWNDGTPVSLDDIYFTYNTLLKENYWNIGALDSYKNLQIQVIQDTIEITFPTPSIDNMIFLTNFILPAHILANQSLETYISTFVKNPVGSHCGILSPNTNDPTSRVFDLAACDNTLLRFYQVKQFGSEAELQRYILSKTNLIDLIASPNIYPGYTRNQVILNRYMTIFFNTKTGRMPVEFRQQLGSWIAENYFINGQTDKIIQDHYLFDNFDTGNSLIDTGFFTQYLGQPAIVLTNEETKIPNLTTGINWGSQETKEFYIGNPIDDKIELTLNFSTQYDRVSVSFNNGVEYFPESFDIETNSTNYNLNPTYRNITRGRNSYTIKGYLDGVHVDTNTLIVYYLTEPTEFLAQNTVGGGGEFIPLQIIYYNEPVSISVVTRLQDMLKQEGIDSYFSFVGYDDPNTFAGKVSSMGHDMVIRTISMGLRKDMSNLVNSAVPDINPSGYVNPDLASAMNNFFLSDIATQNSIKQQIDTIYSNNMPFVILGKELSSMNIRSDLEFPYPFRLYVLGWRRDFVKDIQMFRHLTINRDKVFDIDNFMSFLAQKLEL